MEKLKIAIALIGEEGTYSDLVRQVCDDPAMLELCSPAFYEEEAAYRELNGGKVDALALYSSRGPAKRPAQSVEIVVTEKASFMPLPKEPTAEDIVKFRDILERDFDRRLPRIAIVQETPMQNPDLASQVTAEQGINTYGPYTSEQFLGDDNPSHFDGVVIPEGSSLPSSLSGGAAARFFAGMETVITASLGTLRKEETEEGLADVSNLTKPIYTAIDIVRNRAFYDEARQNPLPKLFRDKRDDRKKDDAPQANSDNDEKGQPS